MKPCQTPPSDAVLQRFLALHPKAIDLSLGRIRELLARLENPQEHLPPLFHIAGTNGKGSTIAFLEACLKASGQRVHAYTSPHLLRFAERVRLDGREIEEAHLYRLLRRCEDANDGRPITWFEITTAAAFLAFAETPADVLLLEVGLGGRLDATNVVPAPEICAITPIGLDHQQHLGNSIAAIAGEKAGIFKPGSMAVSAPQRRPAQQVLDAAADKLKIPLWRHGKEWHIKRSGEKMRYEDAQGALMLPLPALAGEHQIVNAGLALAALRCSALGGDIDGEALARGMRTARNPARLQRIARGALAEAAGANNELWLDGGHNPHAARALAEAMEALRPSKPLHLVVGMLGSKHARGFFAPFRGRANSVATVTIPEQENAASAESLAGHARAAGLRARACSDAREAIRAVSAGGGAQGCRILVCGSLHLAGYCLGLAECG